MKDFQIEEPNVWDPKALPGSQHSNEPLKKAWKEKKKKQS